MEDRKEKKRWGLIVFIVIIMIGTSFSFVLFGFSPSSEKVVYNGIQFTRLPDRWEAKIDGKAAAFSFLPTEVEKLPVLGNATTKLQGKFEIDATSDMNSTLKEPIALAQHQMGLTLWNYNMYVRNGFTSNNTFNFPIITCHDATSNVPVVYFRHANETGIYAENSCIFAEAPSAAEMIKVKDRLLYGVFGVIK